MKFQSKFLPFFAILLSLVLTFKSQAQTNISQEENKVVLSDEEKEIFKEQILKKIKSFQGHLSVITSKESSKEEKLIYTQIALSNFFNRGENVDIEVYSKSKLTGKEKREKKPLIQYLDSLCNLTHAKIYLKTAKLYYVSNWIKAGFDINGNQFYKAIATYYQEFTGYSSEGIALYRDIASAKPMVVEMRVSNDLDSERWIVYLGEISVVETIE